MFKGGESENDTLASSAYQNIDEYCTESLDTGKCVSKIIETHNFHNNESGLAKDSSYISPYNRLKSNISMWEKAGAVLFSVIDAGYKIPF